LTLINLRFPLIAGGLSIALAIATYTDLKSRDIPNWLTFGGTILALIIWSVTGISKGAIFSSMGLSTLGMVVGFIVFFLIALTGSMEYGDVKLMTMMGAFVGWPLILQALMHATIAGFFFAMFWVVLEGNFIRTFKNLWFMFASWILPKRKRITLDKLETSTLPYGVAIALGGWWTLISVKVPAIDIINILTK
jgi:prepilin peptidase CpaA